MQVAHTSLHEAVWQRVDDDEIPTHTLWAKKNVFFTRQLPEQWVHFSAFYICDVLSDTKPRISEECGKFDVYVSRSGLVSLKSGESSRRGRTLVRIIDEYNREGMAGIVTRGMRALLATDFSRATHAEIRNHLSY